MPAAATDPSTEAHATSQAATLVGLPAAPFPPTTQSTNMQQKDEPVAVATALVIVGEAQLENMAVTPGLQGQKLGRLVLSRMLEVR